MSARSQQVRVLSLLAAGLLGVTLVLVNWVAARVVTRIDLTDEGLYTLSDGTRRILAGLKDPAVLRVFWGGLEASSEPTRRKYAALLEEMAEASDGRLSVRWVDVTEDEGKEEARAAGVQEFVFRQRVGDKLVTQTGYSALVVESGSRPPARLEALVDPSRERKFEYLVASTLVSASRRSEKVIALVDGSDPGGGAMGMQGGGGRGRFEQLKAQFKAEFGDVVQWWHSLDQPLADNVETLLLLAPRGINDTQAYHFEQFLLRGGRAIVCLDPVDFVSYLQQPYGEAQTSGLEGWLEHLGVSVGSGIAADDDPDHKLVYPKWVNGRIDVASSGYWFPVLAENLDSTHPALNGMPSFAIYWPAPLSFDAARNAAAGRKVTVLASTGETGVRTSDMDALRRGEIAKGLQREKVPLALLVEGPAESFWKGKPIPGEAPPPAPEMPLPPGPLAPPEPVVPPEPAPAAPETPVKEGDDVKPPAPVEPAPAPAPAPEPVEPAGPKGAPGDEPVPAPASPPTPEAPKPAEPPRTEPAPAEPAPVEPAPAEPPPSALPPGVPLPGVPPADAPPAGPARLDTGSLRLVVIGDADILSDHLGQETALTMPPPMGRGLGTGGKSVVANLLDWMVGDDALLSLRTKATKPRVIERPEDGQRSLIQALNLLAIPLLVGFTGLIVFLRRRSQR